MKIELKKAVQIDGTYYYVYKDGYYVSGSCVINNEQKAYETYEHIKKHKEIGEEVLKCEEI